MKTIQHVQTLFYYDGPQVFEARDAIGGHYVAVMVEPENEHDRYLVTGVAPEQLREFRSGKLDLRSLMLDGGDGAWHLAEIEEGLDRPLRLLPQTAPLLSSGFLPEPGFVLHTSPTTQEPFIQPRFVGPRFEGHTLPLSAAKDLAAYEELVLELAKHLVRQKHGRVKKGFAQGFSLHIERIDDGSAKPALVAMMLGALLPDLPPEIIEAKDLINSVIATEAGQSFPAVFPMDCYSYFNRIGRSLEEGESIEWLPESPTNKTVLTPVKRKRLVLAHRGTYEAEVQEAGLITTLDSDHRTGTLKSLENRTVAFAFDDPFFSDLKEALGNRRLAVSLKGIGVFDVNDRLTAITEIEQLELLPHLELVGGIEALLALQDGWLEGGGKVPDAERLADLMNEMVRVFPSSLEYPAVVPTEDGNVVFEWIRPQARIELEVNFVDQRLELYATNLKTNHFVEETYPQDGWADAFAKVSNLLSV